MSIFLLIEAFFKLLQVKILVVAFNHLINIPLVLFLGVGKYLAFTIAIVMDAAQMVLYYNVLNRTSFGQKFGWAINNKLLKDYKKPEFMSRLHNSWLYLGVMFLSLLPLYFGGMFVAVFTAHTLKLNKVKSYICISLGSIIGCFIWTIGIWNLIELFIQSVKHFYHF